MTVVQSCLLLDCLLGEVVFLNLQLDCLEQLGCDVALVLPEREEIVSHNLEADEEETEETACGSQQEEIVANCSLVLVDLVA